MRYYPMFVNLAGKRCLVVGAGQVGRRKIATLASCGAAEVLVIDTRQPDGECAALLDLPAVRYECRPFEEADLDGRFVVIASTSSEELNWRVSRECARRGILCNIVDQPEKCSFIVPAMFTQGELTVAVSTGGASPAMARKIRLGPNEFFGAEYGLMLLLLSRLRPMVLALDKGPDANSALFRALVDSALIEALRRGDRPAAAAILRDHLPPALHDALRDLLEGVCADAAD